MFSVPRQLIWPFTFRGYCIHYLLKSTYSIIFDLNWKCEHFPGGWIGFKTYCSILGTEITSLKLKKKLFDYTVNVVSEDSIAHGSHNKHPQWIDYIRNAHWLRKLQQIDRHWRKYIKITIWNTSSNTTLSIWNTRNTSRLNCVTPPTVHYLKMTNITVLVGFLIQKLSTLNPANAAESPLCSLAILMASCACSGHVLLPVCYPV